MSYEGSRGFWSHSSAAIKMSPRQGQKPAGRQHKWHTCTQATQTLLQSCEKMLTATTRALHNSCKTNYESEYVCGHMCRCMCWYNMLFFFFLFFEGRKSVEVKGRGWSHLTASPLEKFIKRQLKMSTWASFLLLFPFLYSNCTSIPPLRYQPNVLKIAIGLLFVPWYEYKEFPMSF